MYFRLFSGSPPGPVKSKFVVISLCFAIFKKVVLYTNVHSLEPVEMPGYSVLHPDPSCLHTVLVLIKLT